jgi:hypothetical protein
MIRPSIKTSTTHCSVLPPIQQFATGDTKSFFDARIRYLRLFAARSTKRILSHEPSWAHLTSVVDLRRHADATFDRITLWEPPIFVAAAEASTRGEAAFTYDINVTTLVVPVHQIGLPRVACLCRPSVRPQRLQPGHQP